MGQGSCWAERPTPVRVSAPPTHALLGTEAEGCPVGQEEPLSPELPQPLPPLNQPIAWPPLRAPLTPMCLQVETQPCHRRWRVCFTCVDPVKLFLKRIIRFMNKEYEKVCYAIIIFTSTKLN